MFNNLKETFDEIRFNEERIIKLQKIAKSKKFSHIQIHFFADGKHETLYNIDCDFSLENELRNLIEDIIIDLQNKINDLKQQL